MPPHQTCAAASPTTRRACARALQLKNIDTKLWKDLSQVKAKSKIMISGTPVQNDLNEFYAMVDFTNPQLLGDARKFNRQYQRPVGAWAAAVVLPRLALPQARAGPARVAAGAD